MKPEPRVVKKIKVDGIDLTKEPSAGFRVLCPGCGEPQSQLWERHTPGCPEAPADFVVKWEQATGKQWPERMAEKGGDRRE